MGQILGIDNIPAIVVASTTSLTVAATNNGQPTRITVMGQQYAPTTALTLSTAGTGLNGLDTGALASNTLYYLYAVVSSNVLGLVLSTSASAPTGFTQFANIGRVRTFAGSAGLAASANWLNGVLQTTTVSELGNIGFTSSSIAAFGTSTITDVTCTREGEWLNARLKAKSGTATGATILLAMPVYTINTTKLNSGSDSEVGIAWRHYGSTTAWDSGSSARLFTSGSSNGLFFAYNTAANQNGGWAPIATAAIVNNGDLFELAFRVPISEWAGLYA